MDEYRMATEAEREIARQQIREGHRLAKEAWARSRERERTMDEDSILTLIEHESQRAEERVKRVLMEEGRPDLVEWLDGKLRDVRLGISSAQGKWHALSICQRVALQRLAREEPVEARDATWQALIRRRLIEWRGKPAITEHGRFVVKHGPVNTP